VPDGESSHQAFPVSQLVDHPIGANPQRAQPPQTTTEGVAGFWLALQEAKCFLDGVGQGPVEPEDLMAGPPSKNNLATYLPRRR
jgi:hypothetical protein